MHPLTSTRGCAIFWFMGTNNQAEHEPKFVKQLTLAGFDPMFPDGDSCKAYLRY